MNAQFGLSFSVELQPGEKLEFPRGVVEQVGPGRWIITVSPWNESASEEPIRRHDAFLRGYAPDDEGLYDDLTG